MGDVHLRPSYRGPSELGGRASSGFLIPLVSYRNARRGG